MRLRSATKAKEAATSTIPPPPAIAPSAYKSAYNYDVVTDEGGNFDHFIRTVDQTHIQKTGYWRFLSNEDDQRAYQRGFHRPEDILVAQDQGGYSNDDIALRWVPGRADVYLKMPLQGSAADHLRTIYEIRQELGLPMLLRGEPPVYPISEKTELKEYWEMKYAKSQESLSISLQLGKPGPEKIRMKTPPRPTVSPLSSPVDENSDTIAPDSNHSSSPAHNVHYNTLAINGHSTTKDDITQVPQHLAFSMGSSKSQPENEFTIHTQQRGFYEADQTRNLAVLTSPDRDLYVPQRSSSQPELNIDSTATRSHEAVNTSGCVENGTVSSELNLCLGESSGPGDRNVRHISSGSNGIANGNNEELANDTELSLYEAAIYQLPCMDCGLDVAHTPTCHIGSKSLYILRLQLAEVISGLKPIKYNVINLHAFADATKRFDPGLWTTHFGPLPPADPEDPKAQIKGMADVIRNEESYQNDPELHVLPDDMMIMLWALKTSPGVNSLPENVEWKFKG